MLKGMLHQAQDAAAQTARKAVLGLGALLCLGIGLGFLTAAAWLFIVTVSTALNAALIIGGFYVGVGLILIALMSAKGERKVKPEPVKAKSELSPTETEEMVAKLIAAFMTGLKAGKKARS